MSDREKIVGCLGLVSALLWTHDHGIVHQDLHKSNIVYSVDRSQWVLIDFGNAAWAKTEGKDTVIKGARRQVYCSHGITNGGHYCSIQLSMTWHICLHYSTT